MRSTQSGQPNTSWFTAKLADKRLSQRQLARLMGIDASAVSLMLRGKRKMDVKEAGEVARLLGVHVDEVLRHAGVAVPNAQVMPGAGRVPVTGWIDDEGVVHRGGVLGPTVVESPPMADSSQGAALRFQTGDVSDGWLAFYRPSDGVSLEAVGRLCVVGTETGLEALRVVRRGYESGTWSLTPYRGVARQESALLVSAAPVMWVRTG